MKTDLIRIASKAELYHQVGNLSPGRNSFDLSHQVLFNCDAGELIPVLCEEVYPGDIFNLGAEIVVRGMPMVAPMLHNVYAEMVWFFVSNEILWTSWTNFITGGLNGQDATAMIEWSPTNTAKYSLWDYFGFPIGIVPAGILPTDLIRRGYNTIWNEWYRDENIDAAALMTNEVILKRRWDKGYFTAALPWQQRGIAAAVPLGGTATAVFTQGDAGSQKNLTAQLNGSSGVQALNNTDGGVDSTYSILSRNTVDLSAAGSVALDELRYQVALQKWMERNARCGGRYPEQVRAHFGVSPRDGRFDRPEFIGRVTTPVVISEVLQTGETGTTPQGNLAGHSLAVDTRHGGSYRCTEHGFIFGLFCIVPKLIFNGQGVNRIYSRKDRMSYYWPEFANLSEQAILRGELYATAVEADNETEFGFIGRYDELRTRCSRVSADMRDDFDEWTAAVQFTGAPELNSTFMEITMRDDCFTTPNEKNWICSVGNIVNAIRPLPYISEPGGL